MIAAHIKIHSFVHQYLRAFPVAILTSKMQRIFVQKTAQFRQVSPTLHQHPTHLGAAVNTRQMQRCAAVKLVARSVHISPANQQHRSHFRIALLRGDVQRRTAVSIVLGVQIDTSFYQQCRCFDVVLFDRVVQAGVAVLVSQCDVCFKLQQRAAHICEPVDGCKMQSRLFDYIDCVHVGLFGNEKDCNFNLIELGCIVKGDTAELQYSKNSTTKGKRKKMGDELEKT